MGACVCELDFFEVPTLEVPSGHVLRMPLEFLFGRAFLCCAVKGRCWYSQTLGFSGKL